MIIIIFFFGVGWGRSKEKRSTIGRKVGGWRERKEGAGVCSMCVCGGGGEAALFLPGRTELRFGHLCQHSSDFFLLIISLPHVIQAYNSPGYIKDLEQRRNSTRAK